MSCIVVIDEERANREMLSELAATLETGVSVCPPIGGTLLCS